LEPGWCNTIAVSSAGFAGASDSGGGSEGAVEAPFDIIIGERVLGLPNG
jgi:hypothetical protein